MHRTYQIITDATADMVPEMLVGLPEVQVIPMGVTLGRRPIPMALGRYYRRGILRSAAGRQVRHHFADQSDRLSGIL